MRADAQPHEVIRDETVKDAAEELLNVEIDLGLDAEQRVSRDGARRQHRGDERQPVGRRGDVAVREPGASDGRADEARRVGRTNGEAASRQIAPRWRGLSSLDGWAVARGA